jgi:hypothetical protein
VEPTWDEILNDLSEHVGMYVLAPRLIGAAAYMEGFSRGRQDGVMPGFQGWYAQRHPAEGGHPNPISYESVLADRLFSKRARDLTDAEEAMAVRKLCALIR